MFNRIIRRIAFALALHLTAANAVAAVVEMPGLESPVQVTRDSDGIAHIQARNSHDLFFMQGYIHAGDRLFQMDLTRRQPSGTLAVLFGPSALGGDVLLRTLGLRRGAERSLEAVSQGTRDALDAYAAGVNRWVQDNPLPPEYGILASAFEPWTPLDSAVIAKAIAFSLSFDDEEPFRTEILGAYLATLGTQGAVLFNEDIFRSMPFDCASTIPDATGEFPFLAASDPDTVPNCVSDSARPKAGSSRSIDVSADTATADMSELRILARKASESFRRSDFIKSVLNTEDSTGSNEWGVTGKLGANGRPLVANDPHLALNTPSTFYPVHLMRPDFNVYGSSFAGVPLVVLGRNRHIHWGATTNPMDVSDTFFELLGLTAEGQFYTVFQGNPEPVQRIPEVFQFNDGQGGVAVAPPGPCGFCGAGVVIPAETLIVPRRNNGPIIALLDALPSPGGDPVPALSVQYTGFSGTRELDAFRLWNEARNLEDFKHGLQFFDFGSQNWIYGDVRGNIAYFAGAEAPIRVDLQAGAPAPGGVPGVFPEGLPIPPWFIRDGVTGVHEWQPATNHYPGQATPFEILGPGEMPQVVNPEKRYFVNANNDPAGTTLDNNPLNQLRVGGQGIYYLSPGYAGGFRAGTITLRLREIIKRAGEVTFADMQRIQADVTLLDARYFVPWIRKAWKRAGQSSTPELKALAADPELREAVRRLSKWNFTTPTGIREGYDAGDDPDNLPEPSQAEIDSSVAATIYSVWRGQAIRAIVDATLAELGLPGSGSTLAMTAMKNLFDNFDTRGGLGASGIDFFALPGVADPADRRDLKVLGALRAALDKLAGPDFAPAFAGSTNQDDYRWGRLHWIVFDHPFVPEFSVPPQLGEFPPPLGPQIPGISTDGGFGVVDASSHSARADEWDEFDFGGGPVRRYAAEPAPGKSGRSESIWAGGTSGVPFPGNPFYSNLLPRWLTNDAIVVQLSPGSSRPGAYTIRFVPAE
jgi:penicillin amidase